MLYLAVRLNVGKFSNYINDSTFLNGIYCMCLPGRILPNSRAMHPVSDIFDYFCSPEYVMFVCLVWECRVANQNYRAGSKSGLLGYADESNLNKV